MAKVLNESRKLEESYIFINATPREKLNHFYEMASDFLLLSEFTECIETCISGIRFAKNQTEVSSVTISIRQTSIDGLCSLAIQAMAELDLWFDVLPFALDVYDSVQNIPSNILRLIITIHCQMREFYDIEAVAASWLQSPANFADPQYSTIAETIAVDVLLPQEKSHVLPQFLTSCGGLSPDDGRRITEKVKVALDESINSQVSGRLSALSIAEKDSAVDSTVQHSGFAWLHAILGRAIRRLTSMSYTSLYRFAFMATCAYILTTLLRPGARSRSWPILPGLYRTFSAMARLLLRNQSL